MRSAANTPGTMQLRNSLSNSASVLGKFRTGNAHTSSMQPVGWLTARSGCVQSLRKAVVHRRRAMGNIGAHYHACQTPMLLAHVHADGVPTRQLGKCVTALAGNCRCTSVSSPAPQGPVIRWRGLQKDHVVIPRTSLVSTTSFHR